VIFLSLGFLGFVGHIKVVPNTHATSPFTKEHVKSSRLAITGAFNLKYQFTEMLAWNGVVMLMAGLAVNKLVRSIITS